MCVCVWSICALYFSFSTCHFTVPFNVSCSCSPLTNSIGVFEFLILIEDVNLIRSLVLSFAMLLVGVSDPNRVSPSLA